MQNRLSLFTEFYTHHTRFLFVPNPNVVSYRPQIACRTSVVGRRFGPPKNFCMAPPMGVSNISWVSMVLLLEIELSLWLVLDYGTVCHMTSSRVTHCHISVVDSKHFYLDSHILLLCFSSLPCGFYLGHVKKFLCNVM